MAVGLDSTKEETDAYETPFLARGMAILVFEGPGQGEAQYDFPIRGDYEVPVKAVIDYIETRSDLDSSRIGMWGVSLGGYYAPRAAAFEKRIKACIALGGPFDYRRRVRLAAGPDARDLPHPQPQQDRRGRAQDRQTLTLVGVAQNITCPTYIVNGGSTASCRPPTPSGWRARSKARRSDDDRGRQPHRQQPRLSLAVAERGLDEGQLG